MADDDPADQGGQPSLLVNHIVAHKGSQYSGNGGGVSACGLAAVNCARLLLQKDKSGVHGYDLLRDMSKADTFEAILSICAHWSGTAHLDVDDILSAPIFARSLELLWSEYEQPGERQFQDLLRRLEQLEDSAVALILTRPPEIVSVLRIATNQSPVFVTFDSHPRQDHPEGAAFVLHNTLEGAAVYLAELLKVDPALLDDPSLQWQAQLLAQFSAHVVIAQEASDSQDALSDALLAASLLVLKLGAELAEGKSKIGTLTSENTRLTEENAQLVARVEDLEEDVKRHIRRATFSQPNGDTGVVQVAMSPGAKSSTASHSSNSSYSNATIATPATTNNKLVFHTDLEEDDALFASRIQMEWQDQAGTGFKFPLPKDFEPVQDDEVDERKEGLNLHFPPSFDSCGMCTNERPEDLVKVDICGHGFCRDCAATYLRSKLADRPRGISILCPTCASDGNVDSDPGIISAAFARDVGLSREECELFPEL